MPIYDVIRKNINRAVALSGRSRMQVARDAGVSYPNLCRFINGKRDGLGIDVLCKLSRELGVPLAYFFGELHSKRQRSQKRDGSADFYDLAEDFKNLTPEDQARVKLVIRCLIDSFR